MDLFDYMRAAKMKEEAPLAARMRPRTLEEVVGQEHILGRDKTTLARVIANTTSAEFTQINATVAEKKDYVRQQYLPYELNGREFYQPAGTGYEVKIREHMKRLKEESDSSE